MPTFEACINCINRHTFLDAHGETKTCHCICEKYKKSKVISDERLNQMHKVSNANYTDHWKRGRLK